MKRERKRKGPMRLMPPSGHTHPQGGGGGGGAGEGGSGGQGRVQGRQHSDVSTARLENPTWILANLAPGRGGAHTEAGLWKTARCDSLRRSRAGAPGGGAAPRLSEVELAAVRAGCRSRAGAAVRACRLLPIAYCLLYIVYVFGRAAVASRLAPRGPRTRARARGARPACPGGTGTQSVP
jgi:hypothetical protein